MAVIKWDGVTDADLILKALLFFIDEEDDAEMDAILNDIENDGGDEEDEGSNNATMSKADMKKLAEQQKKLAKQNQKRNG